MGITAKLEAVDDGCPLEIAMNIMTGKWKLPILWQLFKGRKRFNELQRQLCPITQKTLTRELRELEADGLVGRKIYAEIPPRVEYSLTPLGESVRPVLDSLCRWGKEYRARSRES